MVKRLTNHQLQRIEGDLRLRRALEELAKQYTYKAIAQREGCSHNTIFYINQGYVHPEVARRLDGSE